MLIDRIGYNYQRIFAENTILRIVVYIIKLKESITYKFFVTSNHFQICLTGLIQTKHNTLLVSFIMHLMQLYNNIIIISILYLQKKIAIKKV